MLLLHNIIGIRRLIIGIYLIHMGNLLVDNNKNWPEYVSDLRH